jgi:molecular chaperone GrpE
MSDSEQIIDEQATVPGVDSAGANGAAGAAAETDAAAEHDAAAVNGEAERIEGDLDELVTVAAQRDEYLALAQRTQADFENYRKRVARESALAQTRGVTSLAKELLPALDNLDRALEETAANAGDSSERPFVEGVRLVRSELGAALARAGIESFSPLGEPFDPAVHEAMATVAPEGDEVASGTVVEVYQPGYRLGEGIIRPARVVVAA